MAGDGVVITGVGMRTPLGPHAVQSAASIRARINRFRAWPHLGQELGEPGGVTASFVSPDLGDAPWSEKVVPLLRPAAREAAWSARLWDLRDRPDGARGFVSAPPPGRAAGSEQEQAEAVEALAEDWLGDELEIPTSVASQDRAGGAVAVARAVEALRSGKAEVCVVGGVDSFLQSTWLRDLFEAGRLKAGEPPPG